MRLLGLYGLSTTSFRGIRFTWPGIPFSFFAISSACQSWSLTPSIMAYSKLMRRPVFWKYLWQAANSVSTSYARFTGIMRLRVSLSGA